MAGWQWDESLYPGSAANYARGRVACPVALARALRLDGPGRLLDVGCGSGSLTVLLATHFAEAVGLDADLLAETTRPAAAKGITTTRWVHEKAEDLPTGLGAFRLVTFARPFTGSTARGSRRRRAECSPPAAPVSTCTPPPIAAPRPNRRHLTSRSPTWCASPSANPARGPRHPP
ncbi:class I SAM-dependent methyltransferase [Amycolatopsis sp. NPDC023774]|uniref:class I SAM-dependent methyltransferase n=1 Tax=Amycolatopsis sp. NPDC023774 TaxID=3155015 RepID=UPI003410402C